MADLKAEQSKLHGEKLSELVQGQHPDAVPGEDNAHAHSHAAHLSAEGKAHTKPEGNLRQGASPGERREPPHDQARIGKSSRRQ